VDIVTARGTTLLGADDKAGRRICHDDARHLLEHPWRFPTVRSGAVTPAT